MDALDHARAHRHHRVRFLLPDLGEHQRAAPGGEEWDDPGARGAKFFEVNSVDVGGIHYAAATRQVLLEALASIGIRGLSIDRATAASAVAAWNGHRDVRFGDQWA